MEPFSQSQQNQRLLQHEIPLREQTEFKGELTTTVGSAPDTKPLLAKKQRKFWLTSSGDIFLALVATYFIVLGLVSISKNGKTVGEILWLPDLITAASYGPTLFPILFSAVFGRFLTQLAYFLLERGTTVQTMEQLQGSQTVISTLVTQLGLRAWNRDFFLISSTLVLIWSLSPIGSQASLRFISMVERNRPIDFNVSYLDVGAGNPVAEDSGYSPSLANIFFGASIILPASSRSEPQDLYGNIRVPLIEQLEESPSLAWVDVTENTTEHSSLLGVPFTLNSTEASTFSFSFNTSYWWMDCQTQLSTNPIKLGTGMFSEMWLGPIIIAWPVNTTFRGYGVPRTVYFQCPNIITDWENRDNNTFTGTCSMTTTFITVNATCQQPSANQRSCAATAVRRTSFDTKENNRTLLDMYADDTLFFNRLINATSLSYDYTIQMVPGSLGFLADPENPFNFHTNYPDWSNVTAQDFSVRFSQLLNTYFIARSAYQPLRGVYIEGQPDNGGLEGFGSMLYTNATGLIAETALACDAGWSIMLLLAALVVLTAAVSSLVLGSRRHCPEVLNNFSVLLKDNPYAIVKNSDTVSSMSDGSELAKAWRSERVQIGDVMTDNDAEGYVAIGTPDTVSMGPLGSKQTYI